MQVTMKLIGSHAVDFRGLGGSTKVCGPFTPGPGSTEPQEPIHVQVRIRQHAEALPELRWARAGGPNPRRLPVGMLLDCYL